MCRTKGTTRFTATVLHSISLSQRGVCITKMEKLLLQENGYWPDKVIIYSIPHTSCRHQEDDFHACRIRMVLSFKPQEQDSGNQGSVALDGVPPHHSTSAPVARRRPMWHLLLWFLATTVLHWLGCSAVPSPWPWYRGPLTSATTATATLLCGAFHMHDACSAVLSSR